MYRAIVIQILSVLVFTAFAYADKEPTPVDDLRGDTAIRKTDPGANGPVNQQLHRLPDILSYQIGTWNPKRADSDLFNGKWEVDGDFFRLNIVFAGLMNPPGLLGESFRPFKYGNHPIFGYIELDMDDNPDTGGEFDFNNQAEGSADLRFQGSVARFGGHPEGQVFKDRIAFDGSAFDGLLETMPLADRSGEEFHVALQGWDIDNIDERKCRSQCDGIFDEGEQWVVHGTMFHRAHAFEGFSFACCPGGEYNPEVQIMFEHNKGKDETTISLVYPLSNSGSAAQRGEQNVEGNDGRTTNQNSVHEALDDLTFSTRNALPDWRNDPNFPIIAGWEFEDPDDAMDPEQWRVTLLVGTSYTTFENDALFVWTDHFPNIQSGDFDGDGHIDTDDNEQCRQFINDFDGDEDVDCDAQIDGGITLCEFGHNFSIYDINYDGFVNHADCACIDCNVDLNDFALFQQCYTGEDGGPIQDPCENMDFDTDDDVDMADYIIFFASFAGP